MTAIAHPLLYLFAEKAGGGSSTEHTVAIFFLEILLMLVIGRVLGEVMQRVGQPEVMGQLIAGIVIGPSVFGTLFPNGYHWVFPDDPTQKRMIDAIAQLGILLLLVLTGIETDLKLVSRMRKTAFFTSLAGIAVPFACGFTLGQFLPDALMPDPSRHLVTSLFLATALSISSVKIVAMVIMEVGFLRRNVGQIILASAILDDTIGWIIIAIIGGLASRGTVDIAGAGFAFLGTIIFLGVCFTIGRRAVAVVIRWTNDNLVSEMPVLTAILAMMIALALVTDLIGVHTVLGAFVVGIMVGQSPILTERIEKQLRGMIVGFFAPIFFTVAGREIDLSVLHSFSQIGLALGLIVIASVGKIGGAFLGGYMGGMTARQLMVLAFGMNARGSTEVIVATIGLSLGVLNQDLFTLIVVMAIVTTMITPPLLRWALRRIPPTGEEKKRLEREEAEASEFVPSIERILVAVDGGKNGKLATVTAGLLAGKRKVTTTVLDFHNKSQERKDDLDTKANRAIDTGARNDESDETGGGDKPTLLIKSADDQDVSAAMSKELEKGYDMLFIGIDGVLDKHEPLAKVIPEKLAALIQDHKGAAAIAVSRGRRSPESLLTKPKILVPSTGADYSQRAAEIAVVLAHAAGGSVTALHVLPPVSTTDVLRRPGEIRSAGRQVLREIKQLGERGDLKVRTLLRTSNAVDDAILRQIKKDEYDLVVVGAKQRPGDTVFFGRSVAVLAEKSPCSVLVVNS